MPDKSNLTPKQKYLEYLVPRLKDTQIDRMLAAGNCFTNPKAEKDNAKNNAYDKAMGMVGCRNAKEQLNAMIADYRMREIAVARGKKTEKAYMHAVFTGNPGCGKTLFARLYAKILAEMGVIQSDRFIETSRAGLVGEYAGTTAGRVENIVKRAKGGVLFIDEAYSLCEQKGSYGEEAINELILCLENHPDTMVILAGYPDRMEEFLDSNPGLRSRIPYRVEFEDYSTDELIEISKAIAGGKGFSITEAAIRKLTDIFDSAKKQKDFGNARYCRNIIEAAVRKKGLNLGVIEKSLAEYCDCAVYSDEALFSLDESCISSPIKTPKAVRNPIGFVV